MRDYADELTRAGFTVTQNPMIEEREVLDGLPYAGCLLATLTDKGYAFALILREAFTHPLSQEAAQWAMVMKQHLEDQGIGQDGWNSRRDGDIELWFSRSQAEAHIAARLETVSNAEE